MIALFLLFLRVFKRWMTRTVLICAHKYLKILEIAHDSLTLGNDCKISFMI